MTSDSPFIEYIYHTSTVKRMAAAAKAIRESKEQFAKLPPERQKQLRAAFQMAQREAQFQLDYERPE
ncbi:MAG: hypothetical protein ACKODT_07960 [Fluviibacter sp.]